MSRSSHQDFTHLLQQLMQQVGISSLKALAKKAKVSERQLMRLRQGQASKMRLDTLLNLSETLQVSLTELLTTFDSLKLLPELDSQATLKQEYQRLQVQMQQQRESLTQEFQTLSLQTLESWLLQWPTAEYAAKQNEQLPAVRLVALLQPVKKLVEQWGVEAIASVGEKLPYDPQIHQLLEGSVQPGDTVIVSHVGYRQSDKLLYRAKVKPI